MKEESKKDIFNISLPKGAVLYKEGDEAQYCYYIEKGQVELSSSSGTEGPFLIHKGDMFGIMPVLGSGKRIFSAVALENSDLIVITRDTIIRHIENARPLTVMLIKGLLIRTRYLQDGGSSLLLPEILKIFTSKKGLALQQLEREHELKQAIHQNDLLPLFQPIVSLQDKSLLGFETLISCPDPQYGLCDTKDFMAIAEESDLIFKIDAIVFNAVDKMYNNTIKKQKKNALFFSINLSHRHFYNDNVVGVVQTFLEKSKLPPKFLKFEVTESTLIENPDLASQILTRLKSLGVSICLDNFGIGYSSLVYLYKFPIDVLKIDHSLVNQVKSSGRCLEIVRTIINLAHSMKIQVVAEGIESSDVSDILKGMGCFSGQGHYYSEPVTEKGLAEYMGHN